jgi:hypothetical protein
VDNELSNFNSWWEIYEKDEAALRPCIQDSRNCYASTQRLEDLIAGDERAWRETRGGVRGEAGEPGSHEDTLQATLGIDEALGGVYENAALRNHCAFFVVGLSIAPVRLGGHRLEEASAAECRLQAVPSWPFGP